MANTMSVATISDPEFINLQPLDVNPMMSKCEIKVLYTGENRNGSYITKDVATEMAKTLRGAPIVGYYRDEKDDFTDHGDKITIDDEGIKFECMTQPYGFVAPDAQVWFKTFDEQDEFGNTIQREYLMTTGYLWTGQYEEAKLAINEGRPQSMELDNETLDGHWAENSKNGMEFFIINDAIFSKLCILGEDVEPCFEGASVTAPDISTSFTLDDKFRHNLYTMMQELKDALEGGETKMQNEEKNPEEEISTTEEFTQKNQDESGKFEMEKNENLVEDENSSEEVNEEVKDYALLESQYNELKDKYTELESQYQTLVDFKNEVELQQKRDLIQSFYMLSDEDKKDVNENIAKYSLDEIEAKLSVICVRKKVDFNLKDNEKTNDDTPEQQKEPVTYTLNQDQGDSVPAWVAALRKTKEQYE